MEAPPLGKTPSNVKKVISAFESSLRQDTKPRIKPTLRNTQHSVVEKQTSLRVKQSKKASDDNTKPTLSETTMEPPLEEELTRDLAYIKQKEHKHNFIEYGRNSVIGESKMQRPARNSQEVNTTGTSAKEVESASRVKDEKFPSKRSGGWIFLDEGRRLCVTTGGNQMLDLVRGRTSYTFIRKGDMKISMEVNRGTSETKANGGKHNHQKMIKLESSDDVQPSEGPLANALKIAIMIGFGTLVLLTTQRKEKVCKKSSCLRQFDVFCLKCCKSSSSMHQCFAINKAHVVKSCEHAGRMNGRSGLEPETNLL